MIIFWLTLRIWCFFFELLQETELFYQTEKQNLFKFARSGKYHFLFAQFTSSILIFSLLSFLLRDLVEFSYHQRSPLLPRAFFNKQRVLVSVLTFLRSLLESEKLLLCWSCVFTKTITNFFFVPHWRRNLFNQEIGRWFESQRISKTANFDKFFVSNLFA